MMEALTEVGHGAEEERRVAAPGFAKFVVIKKPATKELRAPIRSPARR